MRSLRLWVVLAATTILTNVLATGQTLEIGSPAPALTVSKWIKGSPIDLAAARGKGITVVEFWATWCPPCIASIPHLTKLQHEYADKNVRIVGITEPREDNTLEMVTAFVKQRGDAMNYTVAFDNDGKASRAYMMAAGIDGIPTAFVINQEGLIAWIGFPDGALDAVLAELVAGKYDLALAKRIARIDKRAEAAAMFGEWKEALAAMDEAIALRPGSVDRWMQKFMIWAEYIGNHDEAKECARKALALAAGDPAKTAEIASHLITDEDEYGYNAIAMEALDRAAARSPKNGEIRIARFRGLAARGDDAKYLALAEETIELLKGDPASLSRFAVILATPGYHTRCGDLALRAIDLAVAAEPGEPMHLLMKFHIEHTSRNDHKSATATGRRLIRSAESDVDFLSGFAWSLLTDEATKGKFNQLALAAAETMAKSPGGDAWSPLDTLALAKFETGAVLEAVEIQKRAVAKCDNEYARATLEATLKRFQESGH